MSIKSFAVKGIVSACILAALNACSETPVFQPNDPKVTAVLDPIIKNGGSEKSVGEYFVLRSMEGKAAGVIHVMQFRKMYENTVECLVYESWVAHEKGTRKTQSSYQADFCRPAAKPPEAKPEGNNYE